MAYNFKKIEKKWQKVWQEKKVSKTQDKSKKKKFYVLDMFPYPSGDGLHVGHVEGYTASDIISRFKRMNGYNVLHPMGWDAFGLPAENYAIKNKIHPKIAVDRNIKNFKKQLNSIGFDYDWSREITTTDEDYYKWTQWIFLQLYKKGLAFESHEPIIWCSSCKTGLAQEDLEDGKCERCKSVVSKKKLRQWVLRITDYADRLLEDLDALDWPEKIKLIQRNWIGKSEGAEIEFVIKGTGARISVFTTRPDTLFGVTYAVLAPEHKLIEDLKSHISNFKEVEAYVKKAEAKTELERQAEQKDKTGVELKGVVAINPVNGDEVPVWTSDYVLGSYGTGAVMAVPAHDERDFDFAKKFELDIKAVVINPHTAVFPRPEASSEVIRAITKDIEKSGAYEDDGTLVNSGQFSGIESEKARSAIVEWLAGRGLAKKVVKYKLQDWVFSRQRYWGEPIPIIRCADCGIVPVPEKDLPVKLPKVKSYEPTGTGESPLADIEKWVNVKCPKCKGPAKRETNTMPQWAGSSWYYLRFIDPKNKKSFVDAKKEKYWMPVDLYIGGVEHAARHLIYARFWHKVLFDLKLVSGKEPFKKLMNQGLILGPDGQKMSKSRGNVINPDDVVNEFGADTLRMYEMFMGPFEDNKPWDVKGIIGIERFLNRVHKIYQTPNIKAKVLNKELEKSIHKTVKKVTSDIEEFKFNTAISALMVLLGEMEKNPTEISLENKKIFLKLLAPLAPHITEELWHELGGKKSIHLETWPEYDPRLIKDEDFELIIQVNGKVRDSVRVPIDIEEKEALKLSLVRDDVQKWVGDNVVRKVIFVPKKLINIVI